jgi:hypothetical protein
MAALVKCPRCELNYVRPGEKYCLVCLRELKGLDDRHEHVELCPVCGERPVAPGEELCAQCMREQKSLEVQVDDHFDGPTEELLSEVDDLDDLEELEIVEVEEDVDAPDGELDEIDRELGGGDELDEEL